MVDVAVLGAGRMGAAIALRLASFGHVVKLWNRTHASALAVAGKDPFHNVQAVAEAAAAVEGSAVVLSVLADGAATRSVLLDKALLRALAPRAVICDLGTSGVETARSLAHALTRAGFEFVDAPVSGSVPAVESGTLLVMAAGTEAAVGLAKPVLDTLARGVIRVGEPGAGQTMKLAVNLVVHDLNAALSESLMLAECAGISRTAAYDILRQSVVGAPYVQYKRAAFLEPDTPVAMSLALVAKDLRLILELAGQLGVPAPVTAATCAQVDDAVSSGLGSADMAALSRFRRAGRAG